MSWTNLTPDMACVIFDTETNGLFRGQKEPRMVQLAWSICTPEHAGIKKRSHIVRADDFDPNPTRKLSHGINKARALKEGIEAHTILREFISDIECFGVKFLVAHNVEFDVKVLRAESQRTGIDLASVLSLPKLCTMMASTWRLKLERPDTESRLDAYRENHDMRRRRAKRGYAYYQQVLSERTPKYPSLRELHSHFFGEINADWHNALSDVEACERCFQIIAKEKIEAHARMLIQRQKYEAELPIRREKERVEAEKRKFEQELSRQIEVQNHTRKNVGTGVGAAVGLAVGGPLGAVVGGVIGRGIGAIFGKK